MIRVLSSAVASLAVVALVSTAPISAFQQANITYARELAIGDELLSLQIYVQSKRGDLKMFGHSDFNMVATPVVSSTANGQASVYYNGFAQFSEGGTVNSYQLVDGTLYYTESGGGSASVECSQPQQTGMPPVQEMLEALNSAVPTTMGSSSEAVGCPSEYLWQADFMGEPYVICTQRASQGGFTITGADFDMDIVFLPARVDISAPALPADQLAGCAATPQPTTLTAATLSLLSGVASPAWSGPFPNQETSFETTFACKSTPRRCLFVHGLGRTGNNKVEKSSDYFGSYIASYAPCCKSFNYASLDTVNNAWHSDELQKRLCMATQVSGATAVDIPAWTASVTISDTIIVTHSMGNLMLGGAIANGYCTLAASSTWVGLSGPMKGSMASDYIQNECATSYSLVGWIAGLIGQCPVNVATRNLAYQGEAYALSSSLLAAKYTAAQAKYTANVKAVMCSNDYSGLSATSDWAIYHAAGDIVPHKTSEHDGIVEFDSCRAGFARNAFAADYNSPFYVTTLNHMDTAFRNGDGWYGSARKPLSWFARLL